MVLAPRASRPKPDAPTVAGKAIAVGMVALIGLSAAFSWFIFRQRQKNMTVVCEAEFLDEDALENRINACAQVCSTGGTKACLRYVDAMLRMPRIGARSAGDAVEALSYACSKAEPGACEALRDFGDRLKEGRSGMVQDNERADLAYRRACAGGDTVACSRSHGGKPAPSP